MAQGELRDGSFHLCWRRTVDNREAEMSAPASAGGPFSPMPPFPLSKEEEAVMDKEMKELLAKKKDQKVFFSDKQVIEWVMSDECGTDLYKILDVKKTDSRKEMEKQFRKMGPLVHAKISEEPDAPKAFKKVLQAFLILADDKNKATYDEVGIDGIDKSKLADADVPDVTDVLTEGKNKSTEFMTDALRRVSSCGDEMYTTLGLDEKKGSTYTMEQISEAFKETQDGLELDLDNIMLYSSALSKLVQSYTVLSEPKQRALYDTGKLKVDTTPDPDDMCGQKSLQRLLERETQPAPEGMRKRKKKKKSLDDMTEDDLPPEFQNLYRELTGQTPLPEPENQEWKPSTPWYKDFRLFFMILLVLLYFGIMWQAQRMPAPKKPPTMDEIMTQVPR
mmetsp:Transcript_90439/g.165636  ORF Transcript_90439/g.165636 Transcript_90439/m.165636 type:complete len:391 (-) Transcript_90439:83-1255(-)